MLILVNLEINRKKHIMYINYQPHHMSFCSREKQLFLKRLVQLRSIVYVTVITGPVNCLGAQVC